jgi:hypothetical protein
MATTGGAAAAIEGLHRKYTWEGLAAPMVVERCCAARLGVKAATQQATRARRTALAAATRRAARVGAGGSWQGASGPLVHGGLAGAYALAASGGSTGFSAPLGPYSGPLLAAGSGGSGQHSAPMAALPQGASGALAALPGMMHGVLLPACADASGHGLSAAPLLRTHSGHSSGLSYSTASSSAMPPGLCAPAAQGFSAGSPYGSPYGSPPDPTAPHLAAAGASSGALPYLGDPAAGAGAPAAAPLCGLALQAPEQVSLVIEHAATLSALSGAAFWLQPPPPGAHPGAVPAASTLALSGSPAQVAAAAELITQLLLRGVPPAPACWP